MYHACQKFQECVGGMSDDKGNIDRMVYYRCHSIDTTRYSRDLRLVVRVGIGISRLGGMSDERTLT